MDRSRLCSVANDAGRASRYPGAPWLSPDSAREDVVAWMQWNDPNGVHTDELAIGEGFDPYTVEGAWRALAEMLEDT